MILRRATDSFPRIDRDILIGVIKRYKNLSDEGQDIYTRATLEYLTKVNPYLIGVLDVVERWEIPGARVLFLIYELVNDQLRKNMLHGEEYRKPQRATEKKGKVDDGN